MIFLPFAFIRQDDPVHKFCMQLVFLDTLRFIQNSPSCLPEWAPKAFAFPTQRASKAFQFAKYEHILK